MSRAFRLVLSSLVVLGVARCATADEAWRPVAASSPVASKTGAVSSTVQTCNCEQTVTVRRPVTETTLREEQYTVMQPVTVIQPQSVQQGRWVTNYVQQPGPDRTRLRWVRGGWATDAQTGQSFWRPGMFRPTRVQDPGPIQPVTSWQGQPVTVQMPVTTMVPTVQTRRVPVQTQRWVEEQQVQRVPGCVCSHAAPLGSTLLPATPLSATPLNPAPLGATPISPTTPQEAAPLKPIPRPELDPNERVPEPRTSPYAPSAEERKPSSPARVLPVDISRVAVYAPLTPLRRSK